VAVALFGLMSFVMSIIGLKLGGKLGTAAGEHGEVVGAIVLIGISGAMAMGWLLPGRLGTSSACLAMFTAASGDGCTVTSNMSRWPPGVVLNADGHSRRAASMPGSARQGAGWPGTVTT
jgi:Putative manganese efflux pump